MATSVRVALPLVALLPVLAGNEAALAQQPLLTLNQNAYSRQLPGPGLAFSLQGRVGDVSVLVADLQTGRTRLFGADFDLALSNNVVPLWFGSPAASTQILPFSASTLPAGVPVYLQAGSWDPTAGLSSMLASNVESLAAHDQLEAIVYRFDHLNFGAVGVFDRTQSSRFQALPASRRLAYSLPQLSMPVFQSLAAISPLHPQGARCQMALRAADLGGSGVNERLTSVRWRPMFGTVRPESLQQFELRLAHSDVVPDFTIDSFSALPVNPGSGLAVDFANNPRSGTEVVGFSGTYSIQPSNLLPSGYLPFPLAQPFEWDGTSTLLLETRTSPQAAPSVTRNEMAANLAVLSSPLPNASMWAVAGDSGQPSPLSPAAVASGRGGSLVYDLELELERTVSFHETSWLFTHSGTNYHPAILGSHVPAGCSLLVEFRGATFDFATVTNWSISQDVADGLPFLQLRITLTVPFGASDMPWVDTLIVPVS